MPGTHGDLFSEIGRLVVAAHGGEAIDLDVTAAELSRRYVNLRLPPETIARAIARSLGAISVSMQVLRQAEDERAHEAFGATARGGLDPLPGGQDIPKERVKSASALFPSGVRLAMLS